MTPAPPLLRRVLDPRCRVPPPPRQVGALLAGCGMLYGVAMASYGGLGGARWLHLLYVALKVPLLLGLTFALCLPSFFVLSSLLGLRRDFSLARAALWRSQVVVAVTLASLAPYTLLAYASGIGYAEALLFNAGVFALGSAAGQLALRARFRPLIARNVRQRTALRIWFGLYAFVGIQLGWVLRPFVGSPGSPVRLVREEAWGNAYLVVWRLLRDVLG